MDNSLVECSKVSVRKSTIDNAGLGAFANTFIKKGEIVEIGLVKQVNCNGHKNPYLFTWSKDRNVWAYAAGCATFYNTSNNSNTHIERDFDNFSYKIYATRDIQKDEELTHTYLSLKWRECFVKDSKLD